MQEAPREPYRIVSGSLSPMSQDALLRTAAEGYERYPNEG